MIGVGTGRTLRAAVENLPRMKCPQHRLVSLTGNIAPDGSAAIYNVIFSLADKIDAAHYPMPLPVVATSPQERALLLQQKVVQASLELARQADIAFVGIGEVGPQAQLLMDRFISESERDELVATGGIGEVVGWVYDADGRILDCAFNKRVVSPPFPLAAGNRGHRRRHGCVETRQYPCGPERGSHRRADHRRDHRIRFGPELNAAPGGRRRERPWDTLHCSV